VVAWIVDSTWGTISAAAAPCATRAATNMPGVAASPQANEVRVNKASPTTKRRRRPNVSPRRPPSTSRTPYAMPYPATTNSKVAGVAPSVLPMVGRRR